MSEFLQGSLFFSWELFKFMIFFYMVWAPGFLISGMISCRYRRSAWKTVVGQSKEGVRGIIQAIGLGIVGSSGREASLSATFDLLEEGVSPSRAFAFLIASRNMTVHFWSIFALSLGAEFATGQLLGALIMIGIIAPCLSWLDLQLTGKSSPEKHKSGLCLNLSWSSMWGCVFSFIGRETVRFGPSLLIGVFLAGIIFAAGLRPWWPQFAKVFGYAALPSDLLNSVAAPFLAAIVFLSPVGNLPVIHALFKTDGLSYAGIISFCLASSIHLKDMKIYSKAFGPRKTLALAGMLYVAAVLGGLGSTWIYAAFGFRPSLPPAKLASKLVRAVFEYLGF